MPAGRVWAGAQGPGRLPEGFFTVRGDMQRLLQRFRISEAGQVAGLTGNGMHLSQVGLVFLFVLLTREAAVAEPPASGQDQPPPPPTPSGSGGGAPASSHDHPALPRPL